MSRPQRVEHDCKVGKTDRQWTRNLGGDTTDRGVHSHEVWSCSCGYEFEVRRNTKTFWNTKFGKHRG